MTRVSDPLAVVGEVGGDVVGGLCQRKGRGCRRQRRTPFISILLFGVDSRGCAVTTRLVRERREQVEMLALPTDEQLLLRKTMESFASDHALSSPKVLDMFDRGRTWDALASAGLLGLRSGNDGEAPLASGIDIMIVVESLAARLVPVPYIGSAVMSQELMRLTSAPESWSSGMEDGSVRCAVLFEPDLIDIGSQGGVERRYAYDSWDAARVLCLSEGEGQRTLECWEVESLEPIDWIDLTRNVSRVGLGEHLGRIPLPATAWRRWTALSLVATTADMVGSYARRPFRRSAVCDAARAVRCSHRQVPGGATPVRGGARIHRGVSQLDRTTRPGLSMSWNPTRPCSRPVRRRPTRRG